MKYKILGVLISMLLILSATTVTGFSTEVTIENDLSIYRNNIDPEFSLGRPSNIDIDVYNPKTFINEDEPINEDIDNIEEINNPIVNINENNPTWFDVYVDDDFLKSVGPNVKTLWEANNNVSIGGRVHVNDGVYGYGQFTKSLSLFEGTGGTITASIEFTETVTDIRNLNVTGTGNGVKLNGVSSTTISDSKFFDNQWMGIILEQSSNNVIHHCTCLNNGYTGIKLNDNSQGNSIEHCTIDGSTEYHGICLNNGCTGNSIMNCTITNVNQSAIYILSSSHNNHIENCTISNTQRYYGISIRASNDNTVYDCSISDMPSIGMWIRENSDSTSISFCTVQRCGKEGIYLGATSGPATDSIIFSCEISECNEHGIYIYESTQNSIDHCNIDQITDDDQNGISIVESSTDNDVDSCTITNVNNSGVLIRESNNNDVYRNTITDSDDFGIYVFDSDHINIEQNTVKNNDGDGVEIRESDDIDINENTIEENGKNGIELHNCGNVEISKNPSIKDNGGWRPFPDNFLHAHGIFLATCTNVDIFNNDAINDNHHIGIYITSHSSGITVTNNKILNNMDDGINCEDSTAAAGGDDDPNWPNDVLIKQNTISGGDHEGIHIYSGSNIIIDDNTVNDNEMGGIYITVGGGTGNIIKNNDVYKNIGTEANEVHHNGIYVRTIGPNSVIIENNEVHHNSRHGIYIWYDIQSTISHTVQNNEVYSNDGHGIHVENINGNKILKNNVHHNHLDGINIEISNQNEIYENDIYENFIIGVHILDNSVQNIIYHNNIYHNPVEGSDVKPANNNWHHAGLEEGNYWLDYFGVDDGSGTGKHAIAGDGIGDTRIPHPAANYDNFPFTKKNGWNLPNLDGEGALDWKDIKPGSTVTGSFKVRNTGAPGSKLDWDIASFPIWGQWSFDPESGIDLKPEDGDVTVQVTVTAPSKKNDDFAGQIKIVNQEDNNDYILIQASLKTYKNKDYNFRSNLHNFIRNIFAKFPIFLQLFRVVKDKLINSSFLSI